MITVLVLLGQVLELRGPRADQRGHPRLLDLAPKTARRVGADGNEEEVPLDLVRRRSPAGAARREACPSTARSLEGRSVDR